MALVDSAGQYDVALSFAGEDRLFAEELATELGRRNIKVFYDQHEKASLWGKDLYQFLSDLYQNRATYCVIFISKDYAEKLWTNHELKAAQARAFREQREYILPIRLDETEIDSILPVVAYLSWPPETASTIADALAAKLLGRTKYLPAVDQVTEKTRESSTPEDPLPIGFPRSVDSPQITPEAKVSISQSGDLPSRWPQARLLSWIAYLRHWLSHTRQRIRLSSSETNTQNSSGLTLRALGAVLAGGLTWIFANQSNAHNAQTGIMIFPDIYIRYIFISMWLIGGALSTFFLLVPCLITALEATDSRQRTKLLAIACSGEVCGLLIGLFSVKWVLSLISIEAPPISSVGAILGEIGGGLTALWMIAPASVSLARALWISLLAFGSLGLTITASIAATKSSALVASWTAHSGAVNSLMVRAKENDIFSAGSDGTLKRWTLLSGHLRTTITKKNEHIEELIPVESDFLAFLAAKTEHAEFLSRTESYELNIMDFAGRERATLPIGKRVYGLFGDAPPHIVWCEQNRSFLALGRRGIEAWSLDDENKIKELPRPSISVDAGFFATYSTMKGFTRSCMLFLAGDFLEVTTLNGLNGQAGPSFSILPRKGDRAISRVAADPTGHWLALVVDGKSYKSRIEILDIQGRLKPRVSEYLGPGSLQALEFSPNGKILAGSGVDGYIDLWNTDSGALLERLEAPFFLQSSIESIAFSPSGHYIVTGGEDGEISVWRLPA